MNKMLDFVKRSSVIGVVLLFAVFIVLSASGKTYAISQKMAYEGNLYNSAGEPLTGSYNMRFSIVLTSGGSSSVIWGPETHTGISVSNGWFSVLLGENIAIDPSSFTDSPLYLKIEIANPPASSNYELMTPSTAIVSVGSAFKAIEAQTAITVSDGSITAAKIAPDAVTMESIAASNAPANDQYLRWYDNSLQWSTVSGGGSSAEADNVTIGTNAFGSLEVKDLGVSSTKLASSAVTAEKLASRSVTLESIDTGGISPTSGQYLKWSGTQLQWATVSGGTGSVEPDEITITTNIDGSLEVKDLGISAGKISSGAITEPKLATDSVTSGAIAAGAVSTSEIASGAVTSVKFANDIDITTTGSIAASSLAGTHYGSGSNLTGITATSVADYSITSTKIATSAVTTDKISAGSVTADAIATGAVTTPKIASDVSINTSGKITAESFYGSGAGLTGIVATTANYATLSGTATTATSAITANYATLSSTATTAATANYATLSGTATTAATATTANTANYATLSGTATTAASATTAIMANYATLSGTATTAATATTANYAALSGTATTAATATTANTANYATLSGTATTAATATTANYAALSGTATTAASATTAITANYATLSGTATTAATATTANTANYATLSGTATTAVTATTANYAALSGTATTAATATTAITANYATLSGTATTAASATTAITANYATLSGTATTAASVVDYSITSTKIATSAVTAEKIGPDSITADAIAAGAVTDEKIELIYSANKVSAEAVMPGIFGTGNGIGISGDKYTVYNNFGIGTNDAAALLHVYSGDNGAYVKLQGSGDTYNYSGLQLWSTNKFWELLHTQSAGQNNNFAIQEYDGVDYYKRLVINPGGNVGIGTVDATSMLTVAGTIELQTGGIKYPDGTIQTSATQSGNILTVEAGRGLSKTSSGNITTLEVVVDNSTLTIETNALKIKPRGITSAEIATGAITKDAIATSNTASNDQYLRWYSNSLQWATVTGGSGGSAEPDYITIGKNDYQSFEVIDLSISTAKVADSSITAVKLAPASVTNESISTGTFSNITGVGTLGSLAVTGALRTSAEVVYTPSAINDITAGTGITSAMLSKKIILIRGSGAPPVTVSADPPIADGTDGQVIILRGTDETNTVTFNSGSSLKLSGGYSFTLGNHDTLMLSYDSVEDLWFELSRSDN